LPACAPGAKLRAVRVLICGLAVAGGIATRTVAQPPPRLELIDTAVLRASRLIESSGVAASGRVPGVLWTHNDSGDEPRLYATDSAGRDLGAVRVAGASNVDWEDLASGPCPGSGEPCLYVADIGDNRRSRRHIVIYRLAEPPPPLAASDTLREAPLESATVLRYPDHPHDAEALVVQRSGPVFIITKEVLGRPLVFRVPARTSAQRPGEADTLQLVGYLDVAPNLARMRLVTGAAVSPDGTILAVRTYSSLHFFRLRGDSLPAPLTPPEGITIPFVEPQGEGVAFLSSEVLVLTSERGDADHATMARLRVVGLPGRAP
jgi:hypothetical protein